MVLEDPLGLKALRQAPPPPLLGLGILNLVGALALCSFLRLGFVLAPGLPLDLPLNPEAVAQARPTDAVLGVYAHGLLVLEGKRIPSSQLQSALEELCKPKPAALAKASVPGSGPTRLLVMLDAQVPLSTLFEVCQQARQAGFQAIQLAARPR